jgi:putative spermidine/putrescine transport system ATP-binding protein
MLAPVSQSDAVTIPETGMAAARGASLTLTNLVKRYGESTAVDDVSLTIPPGEFVTLLGPSGSGKTTTLNMIAGFVDVDEGEILLDGAPIANLPSHKRNIGVVFQHYALFPHMTVAENIEFPLKRRKVAKTERSERVARALDLVRLGDYGDRYPRQLSGGQQQRVALARALVFEPRVLLMDEPLGALDKKLREWLQLEFKRIHEELGITFVYVTHDQEEALVLSDRIAVFNNGRIEQVGSAGELYERPQTLFVAEFIGESNVFHGTVRAAGDGAYSLTGDGFDLLAGEASVRNGAPGALVVRPEHLSIRRDGATPAPEDNMLGGAVRQVIYLGSARKVEVDLPDGRTVTVREPISTGDAPRDGEAIEVFWSCADSVLVADADVHMNDDLERL